MNTKISMIYTFAVALAVALPISAQELMNLAEDGGANYHGGWQSGSNGGYGFGPWQLAAKHGEEGSYAGFFIARKQNQTDLKNITRDMAFGLYANGVEFEEAVAFRSLSQTLEPGDAFSLLLEHGRIRAETGNDPVPPGSIGLSLRSGNAASDVEDYDAGARFQFIYLEGEESYRIIDGENPDRRDTGIPITEHGIELTFILGDRNFYDLQLRVLETDEIHEWKNRRLDGTPGSPIESFAVFTRNGEPHDFYFEGLQVNRVNGIR